VEWISLGGAWWNRGFVKARDRSNGAGCRFGLADKGRRPVMGLEGSYRVRSGSRSKTARPSGPSTCFSSQKVKKVDRLKCVVAFPEMKIEI
jgi:hypothetical protein